MVLKSIKLLQTMNKGITTLFLLFFLTACQGNICYHSYQPVPKAGWKGNDTLSYPIYSHMEAGNYDMQIGVRHLESYPYKDIWLEINHNLKDSTTFQKDTIHLYLADPKGNWYGNGIGGLLQYTTNNILRLHLQENSNQSTINIVHLMKDSLLKSIHDIGIQLERNP